MKYKVQCIKTYETVIPASEMVSQNLLTGETFSAGYSMPESRWTTETGRICTVTSKPALAKLLKTGNWIQLS